MYKGHYVYSKELALTRPENTLRAAFCYCFFSDKEHYEKNIACLHEQERSYYNNLKFEKRMKSYLIGRFAAKQAIAHLTGEENINGILIQPGIFNQPIVVSDVSNLQVSITHCTDFGAALAFPEGHPMGIDIELVSAKQREALEGQVTDREKQQIGLWLSGYDEGLTLIWTAKEALSKVLKTGLMTPFDIFEISAMELSGRYVTCYYKNFPQYKAICFTLCDQYICSIAFPLKTELDLDPYALNLYFAYTNSPNKENTREFAAAEN